MDSAQNNVNNQAQTELVVERVSGDNKTQADRIIGKIGKNTYIPITAAVAIIVAGIYIGSLATKVDAMADKDSPSRAEYNQMCEQLNKIQTGVDGINSYLRGYSK